MIRQRGTSVAVRLAAAAVCGLLAWCCGAVSGLGQVDHSSPDGLPSGSLPADPLNTEAVSASVDTAVVILEFLDAGPTPDMIHVVQDTVRFGDELHLVMDISTPAEDLPLRAPRLEPTGDVNWLVPVPVAELGFWDRIMGRPVASQVDFSSLPSLAGGTRLVQSFRVYRTNPFRLRIGSFLSPVIQVVGRVAGTDEIVGVRTPRVLKWSPLTALLLLLGLVLVLGRLLWARRNGDTALLDRDPPIPAWLNVVTDLRDLLRDGSLGQGDSRAFLDGLARIARRFTAGRYRIAAQEMTGREIITACADLGYRSPVPGKLARLIEDIDRHRYNPEVSGPGWCRDQAVLLFDQITAARIIPLYVEVPSALARQGEIAWNDLNRELSSGPARLRTRGAGTGGQEA